MLNLQIRGLFNPFNQLLFFFKYEVDFISRDFTYIHYNFKTYYLILKYSFLFNVI